jgi:Cu(I)/Ag(I) efflux system periplasmic protein CusF
MQTIRRVISTLTLCMVTQVGLAQSAMIAGQVVKVDQSAKKITIKHGPAPKLDMSAGMTMVYAVSDPNLLSSVKAGDKINFDAEQVSGQLTVTKIERTK